MPVGPAPTLLAIRRRARQTLRRKAGLSLGVLAAGVVAIVAGGLTLTVGEPESLAPSLSTSHAVAPSPGVPKSITCTNGPHVNADYDVFTGPRSTDSPQEIGERYADPAIGESAIVVSQDEQSATVMVLRRDGTAETELVLNYTSFAGWHVERLTSCDHSLAGVR